MDKIILPQLSYKIVGILFKVHSELGPVQKEKNYQDAVEVLFKKNNIKYIREKEVELEVEGEKVPGFFLDFLVKNSLILELKAKRMISHEDVRQVLRYLKATNLPLAIIANFKRKSLEYKRLINPDVMDDYKFKKNENPDSSNPGPNSGLNSVNSGLIRAKDSRITNGKILALDYGTKNIGLAISDREQRQAFVYDTLKVSKNLFEQIKEICHNELIDKIVVGLPLSMKGKYTQKTEEVVYFIEELEDRIKAVVETQDERLSSVEAKKRDNSQGIDENSAQIILQQYLDRNKN